MKRLYILIIFIVIAILLTCPLAAELEGKPRNEISFAMLDASRVPKTGFRVVVWGDCRDDNGTFDKVMAKINEIAPVFSIGLGDYISNGTRAEYDKFIPRLDALNQPLISVPGNHDYDGDDKSIWQKEFGNGNFAYDFAGVRFISLDNADYELDAEELAFLKEELDTDLRTVVLAHAPPAYGRWIVHCFYKGSKELVDLIKEYEVDYAFFAHIHLYDELMIGDTHAIIAGGAGAPLYGKFDFGKSETHVVKLTITPESITHEYVPIED
jgi:Icc-related predicted phosphoesterase